MRLNAFLISAYAEFLLAHSLVFFLKISVLILKLSDFLFENFIFFENLVVFLFQYFHCVFLPQSAPLGRHSVSYFLDQKLFFFFTDVFNTQLDQFFLYVVVVVEIVFFVPSFSFQGLFHWFDLNGLK